MTNKKPAELDIQDPDISIGYLLEHFFEIKKTAGEKITYNELECYNRVMNIDLRSWEAKAIMKIDSIFESSVHG